MDNFDRPDGPLGENWSPVFSVDAESQAGGGGGIAIVDHNYAPINASGWDAYAVWTGVNFRSDQFAQATLEAIASYRSTVSITGASQSGTQTTYAYSLSEGESLITPQDMLITGMSDAGNNGAFLITSLGPGTFTVTNSNGVTRSGETGTGVSPSDSNLGLCLRCTADGKNGYFFVAGTNSYSPNPIVSDGRVWEYETWKFVNGVGTFLADKGQPWQTIDGSPGDVYTFAVVGNELSALKNGVLIQSATDDDLVGGAPGIWTWSVSGPLEYDWGKWSFALVMGSPPGNNGTRMSSWVGSDYPVPQAVVLYPQVQAASDDFNRPDGNLGANWTDIYGMPSNFQIVSGLVSPAIPDANTFGGQFWNASSFLPDQYSQVTLAGNVGAVGIGVCVRCSETDGGNGYLLTAYGAQYYLLNKVVQGTRINLGTISQTPNIGDLIELDVQGSVLISRINGIEVDSRVDADITTGSPGIAGLYGNTGALAGNWVGGNLQLLVSSTSLGAAPNPSTYGQSVTLTATASGSLGTPTGSINFFDGASLLGSGTLSSSGIAVLQTSSLTGGAHTLGATYCGDSTYATFGLCGLHSNRKSSGNNFCCHLFGQSIGLCPPGHIHCNDYGPGRCRSSYRNGNIPR